MVERIEVNLIPNEYRVHSKKITVPQDIVISVIVTTLLIAASFSVWYWKAQEVDLITERIEVVTRDINNEKPVEDEIKQLKESQSAFKAMHQGLMSIKVDQGIWISLLETYCRELPQNSWLTEITGKEKVPEAPKPDAQKQKAKRKGGKPAKAKVAEKPTPPKPSYVEISIKGKTDAFGEVGQYMARLSDYPRVKSVRVVEVKDGGKKGLFDFELAHQYVSAEAVLDSATKAKQVK